MYLKNAPRSRFPQAYLHPMWILLIQLPLSIGGLNLHNSVCIIFIFLLPFQKLPYSPRFVTIF